MTDLLSTLVATQQADTAAPRARHTLPLRVLVEWFYDDCHARNLSPKTLSFYQQKLVWLVAAAGDRRPADLTTDHLKLILLTFLRITYGILRRELASNTTNLPVLRTVATPVGRLAQQEMGLATANEVGNRR